MQKFISTTIALSILLIAGGCTANNQTATQQPVTQQRCTVGDQHPWCMQLTRTKPLGSQDTNAPANPEMQENVTPMPVNHALELTGPGRGPIMMRMGP